MVRIWLALGKRKESPDAVIDIREIVDPDSVDGDVPAGSKEEKREKLPLHRASRTFKIGSNLKQEGRGDHLCNNSLFCQDNQNSRKIFANGGNFLSHRDQTPERGGKEREGGKKKSWGKVLCNLFDGY